MKVNWWSEHIEAYEFFYNHAIAVLHQLDDDDPRRPSLLAHIMRVQQNMEVYEKAEDRYFEKMNKEK